MRRKKREMKNAEPGLGLVLPALKKRVGRPLLYFFIFIFQEYEI
jgi:hypothetical protein